MSRDIESRKFIPEINFQTAEAWKSLTVSHFQIGCKIPIVGNLQNSDDTKFASGKKGAGY